MGIRKYIPDTLTSLNLACGVLGVVFTFKGRVDIAFPLMLAAAVFDFCDGFSARLLGAYSELGKELDSLSDLVSFGVLPAVMLHKMMLNCTFTDSFWCYIPLVMAVFAGLRLAKFNVDERQHESFIGLPTPAAAMLCGALCYFEAVQPGSFISVWATGYVFVPVLAVVLSVLMVSEIPMFSMKFKTQSDHLLNMKRLMFAFNVVVCLAVVLILGFNWSLAVALCFVMYILMNIVFALIPSLR